MRRRLYFVLPNTQVAEIIEEELLLARIDESHIHFLAREDIPLGKLHCANLLQKSDLLHGMVVGLVAGGVTGTISGLLLYLNPELGSFLGMGMILVLAIAGSIIGVWASGMIGISMPNTRLKVFSRNIQEGHVLLMVDVPKARVSEICDLIKQHHPEVDDRGIEATIPAFP